MSDDSPDAIELAVTATLGKAFKEVRTDKPEYYKERRLMRNKVWRRATPSDLITQETEQMYIHDENLHKNIVWILAEEQEFAPSTFIDDLKGL